MAMRISGRARRILARGTALTGCLAASALAQEQNIVGDWSCTMATEEQELGARLNAEFEQSYDSDGSYEREGDIRLVIEAFEVDIAVSIEESGNWRLIDVMTLGETVTDIEFSSSEGPLSEAEAMMLQEMQAEASAQTMEEQTAEIVSLTSTMMELEDPDGAVLVCEKA